MNDFEYQLDYVKKSAEKILWIQDKHPLSPSCGCFHYSYWRDKFSEFGDVRYQEAGAALGILMHPDLYDSSLPPKDKLNQAFSMAIVFWSRQQHADGSFDEWYKNEHGFAVTAFSLIAYGLAYYFLGDQINKEDRNLLLNTAEKSASWLLRHDDFVKTNHQAAGAAALAIMSRIGGDKRFRKEAVKKHDSVLKGQTPEGWFKEISGMDLGYCGVLLDYMMLYRYMLSDDSGIESMKNLYAFMFPFIQPDLTISPEAGICLNSYVSRLGTVLLSEHSLEAAIIAKRFDQENVGFAGIEPYLADDLRLCRWSYLPMVTKLLKNEMVRESRFASACKISPIPQDFDSYFPEAGIYSYKRNGLHLVFLPSGGGVVRAFHSNGKNKKNSTFEDSGYFYKGSKNNKFPLFTGGYNNKRRTEKEKGKITTYLPFVPARFFFPPFWARLLLRIGCSVPYLTFWLRRLIDWYRKTKGTAINQSIAPLSGENTGVFLKRQIVVSGASFKIIDELESPKENLSLDGLKPCVKNDGLEMATGDWFQSNNKTDAKRIMITKEIEVSETQGLTVKILVKI